MSFDIVTTVSPDFIRGVSLFVPSWFRHSGAENVRLHLTKKQTWYETIIQRNENLRDAVCEGAVTGRRILSLDVDCFVVGNLAGGFDGMHPIAVARWPEPNMGVAFFDTTVQFDWAWFFRKLLVAITNRCRDSRTWGVPGQKGRMGDQPPWYAALHAMDDRVRKLDMNVWNFCCAPEDTERELAKHYTQIKVIHVKGRGGWEEEPRLARKLAAVKRYFGDKLKEL
jgi:hypothetical protein